MRINIGERFGRFCVAASDGEELYEQLMPLLTSAQEIRLDFEGVTGFASPFFNAAIGKLLKDFRPEQLRGLLHFEHLAPAGEDVIRRVIENARTFYADTKALEALDVSLTTLADS